MKKTKHRGEILWAIWNPNTQTLDPTTVARSAQRAWYLMHPAYGHPKRDGKDQRAIWRRHGFKAVRVYVWFFTNPHFTTPLTDENSGTTPDAGWFFLTGVKRHCIEQDGVAFVVDSATIKIVLREQYRIDKIDRITSEEAKPILSYPQWLESRLIEREQERENYFATCEKYRSQLAEKEKECERAYEAIRQLKPLWKPHEAWWKQIEVVREAIEKASAGR